MMLPVDTLNHCFCQLFYSGWYFSNKCSAGRTKSVSVFELSLLCPTPSLVSFFGTPAELLRESRVTLIWEAIPFVYYHILCLSSHCVLLIFNQNTELRFGLWVCLQLISMFMRISQRNSHGWLEEYDQSIMDIKVLRNERNVMERQKKLLFLLRYTLY